MMEIVPYGDTPPRVGDVVFFVPPRRDQPVVHRIARLTPAGVATLGDNNTREDAVLLQPEDILGRVIAAWRGQKRREIAGGLRGRMIGRLTHWRRFREAGVSALRPLYATVARLELIPRLLPSRFRPRVVVFHAQGRDQFRLLLGRQVVGRYDDQRLQWRMRRPFRLLVDGRVLQPPQGDDRSGLLHELVLADGSRWVIAAGDEEAARVVSQLAGAMQLRAVNSSAIPPPRASGTGKTCASEQGHPDVVGRLLVVVDGHDPGLSPPARHASMAVEPGGLLVCVLPHLPHADGLYLHLVELSSLLARDMEMRGGVLLHGALAEYRGMGVILAAPGGTGKTTASGRLPPPWRSLCDDNTLVVRDSEGCYWGHPWPTWSRFLQGEPGGAWQVQDAVPLKGIFFLSQALQDHAEPVGPGHAASLLVECAEQASYTMAGGLSKEDRRSLRLERFDNLCALAGAVPAHVLHISLTGPFWREIEQMLGNDLS